MTKLSDISVTRLGVEGPRILLVHGGVQGSRTTGTAHFAMQAKLAERGFQILIPDRPGHGNSPAQSRPDDAEIDGEWVAELLGEGAHLVGHSYGACVALAAATRCPGAVKSLTLIEPGMQSVAVKKIPVLLFVLRLLAILKLSTSPEKRIRRFSKFMHIPNEMGEIVSTPKEYEAMGRAVESLRVVSAEILEQQLFGIRNARIPLLVVTGSWSKGVQVTADVVAKHGNGKRVTIPSPHHFPQSVSESFNILLEQFVHDSEKGSQERPNS